jgi:shikimate dehydrogenase
VPPDVAVPYAEVIGDPIATSKSPLIHKYWLERLDMTGDYRRTRVGAGGLSDFLRKRRSDPNWRGCNVTIPHKEAVVAHVDELDSSAAEIGAVNCIVPRAAGLIGYNTDVDGIAAALDGTVLNRRKVAIIGGGGAARAALRYLSARTAGEIVVLVRDPAKAQSLRSLVSNAGMEIETLDAAAAMLLRGSSAIINASPLGMAGCPEMPGEVTSAVAGEPQATLFDMVYNPVDTAFLSAGKHQKVDGLTMLVGQARRAFELFFAAPAPAADLVLRDLLLSAQG